MISYNELLNNMSPIEIILSNPLIAALLSFVILIFSVILHEVAHGYVAYRLGDPTAHLHGRLTLNPLPHIDPFMTILLPLSLFLSGSPILYGGAKPVPVDIFNLKDKRKDWALVSLAGPATNLLLATAAGLLLKLLFFSGIQIMPNTWITGLIFLFLFLTLSINTGIAMFNLLPIPPLDGSKVFSLLLPEKEAATYLSIGQIGSIFIFVLLITPLGGFSLRAFLLGLHTKFIALFGLPI